MKLKKVKKLVSGFFAAVMAMSCFVTSVGAEGGDLEKVKREFSLNYLNSLPKQGQADCDKFLNLDPLKEDNLKSYRHEDFKHSDGKLDGADIDEKKVYSDIKNEVTKIESAVKDGSFENTITDEKQKKEYNKMPEKMKIAGAIYEWVSKNIKYDNEHLIKDQNGERPFGKPQDVFFVYSQNTGVCLGKARLVTLMMRLAKIPSCCVDTDGHAYNAVYLKQEDNADRTGWVLLDSSEGGKVNLHQCFPAFYNSEHSFKANNEDFLKEPSYGDIWLLMGIDSTQRYYFTIDGVSYAPVYGYDLDHSYFEVFNSDWEKKHNINVKNYTIPPFIASLGMSLQILGGIESIDLKDDKEADVLDISKACGLKSITKNGSDNYIFMTGALESKKTKAGMILDKKTKKVIKSPSKWEPMIWQTEQGVWYEIHLNNENNKIAKIVLGGSQDPEAKDVKVPEYLTQFNVPIKIESNIKSLILEGDEILDLYWANGLESIDIRNSKRYEVRNGGVFDKISNTMLQSPMYGKRVNVLK